MPETPLLLGRLLAARRHVPNVATLESAKLFSLQELNATPNRPDMLRRFERNNVLVGNDESSASPHRSPPLRITGPSYSKPQGQTMKYTI